MIAGLADDSRGLRTIAVPSLTLDDVAHARRRRLQRAGAGLPCVVCGTPAPSTSRFVHVIAGGALILHPDSEDDYVSDAGDMYAQPIGRDCLRRHPELREFLVRRPRRRRTQEGS